MRIGRFLTLIAILGMPFCGFADGQDGKAGGGGLSGENGKAGKVVIAHGCKDWVEQTIPTINSTFDTDSFADDGETEFVCGKDPGFTPADIEKFQHIVIGKTRTLLASGYFDSGETVNEALPKTWAGLKEQIRLLGGLIKELENNRERELGCVKGHVASDGIDKGEFNICFRLEVRGLEADGAVTAKITMTGTAFNADGSLAKYRTFEEQSPVDRFPTKCKNGAVVYDAEDIGSSNGIEFAHDVSSTCESYNSIYSKIYPGLKVTY